MQSFLKITQERYDNMLGALPPIYGRAGFMVGEPWRHNSEGIAMYAPFVCLSGDCYEGREPMTIAEFQAMQVSDFLTMIEGV